LETIILVIRGDFMKINRRDEKLDALLGKKVTITFRDKDEKTGILGWQGAFDYSNGLKSFCYYIKMDNGIYCSFRKTCVIHVREVKN
jgi:hypothetical protein